jgi:hypothetical protein
MKQQSTLIYGLKKELRYNDFRDDEDWISCEYDIYHQQITEEFSKNNKKVLNNIIQELKKDQFKCVLEIGIARSKEYSSTYYLLGQKPEDTIYVGVDISGVCIDFLKQWNFPNTHAVNTYSSNHKEVFRKLKELNITEIDLLIIDGWHSINQCYEDFKYAEWLRKGGYVLMHDTNYHPGPRALMESINPDIFETKKYFEGEVDWGIGTAKKLK